MTNIVICFWVMLIAYSVALFCLLRMYKDSERARIKAERALKELGMALEKLKADREKAVVRLAQCDVVLFDDDTPSLKTYIALHNMRF